MNGLRVVFLLGLLIGSTIAMPGAPRAAQTTSAKDAQSSTPGLRKPTGNAAAQPNPEPGNHTPPNNRQLSGDAKKQVESLTKTIEQLVSSGNFGESIGPAQQVEAICNHALGPTHWQTADARREVDALRKIAGLPPEGRRAMMTVPTLRKEAATAMTRGRYAQSESLYRKVMDINGQWLGEHHIATEVGRVGVALSLDDQGKYVAGEALLRASLASVSATLGENHPDFASTCDNLAGNLNLQGKYSQAEVLFRKALTLRLKLLDDDSPDIATSLNNLAANLHTQGKYLDAEPLFRQALALLVKVMGEDDPETASSYKILSTNLSAQGKYAEAEMLSRRALKTRLKVLGQDHPQTAESFDNLAAILDKHGRHAEAEPLIRRALAIRLEALGDDHPQIALNYSHLALNLISQGKYAESERLLQRALAIRLKTFGEDHQDTALSFNNLAGNFFSQGKYAEAEPLFRKALEIYRKVVGDNHPETARCYSNIARNLENDKKYDEAESPHRQALAIRIRALGEKHPDVARSYTNLAINLYHQRKYAEAESASRRALAIGTDVLGVDHPDCGEYHSVLASVLDAEGMLDDAVNHLSRSVELDDRARLLRSASGLERSLKAAPTGDYLAICLARQGRRGEAWSRWEATLGRSVLDDLSASQLRPLTPEQRSLETDLLGRIQRTDEQIRRLLGHANRTQQEDERLEELRREQSTLVGRHIDFENELNAQYHALAGKPMTLSKIQAALPAGTALVGWVEALDHHWVCLVKREGEPIWIKLNGSGPRKEWTKGDAQLPMRVRESFASRSGARNQPSWRELATALARQRLDPIRPHLGGVRRMIVLPSAALTGVPIEVLIAVGSSEMPGIVISYAPSGSMIAYMSAQRSKARAPFRLLAVGDPAFPRPAPIAPAPAPPDHGIAVLAVVPNGIGDLFGVKAGDVLLEYNGKTLRSHSDLAVVPVGDKAIRVPVKLWRDGEIRSIEIAAGRLGIQSNPNRGVAQVVLARRAADEVLRSGVCSEGLAPLPGTRREVQAIAALFPESQATTLLGAQATESSVQRLAQSGALKRYGFIHLATHGKANPDVAMSSTVFLAAESEKPAVSADPSASEFAPDGQVTAAQIVRTWDLDADLVVLSACESAVGHFAGGEGYLGFAQALFVKGARTLVLSQWRVDDKATSLLMTRFYQNLLGKRPALAKPMPKAEALQEAKMWLRSLTTDQIQSELVALERGDVRPLATINGTKLPDASLSTRSSGVHPYDHPYYWAAFVLVGDPD